MGRLCGLIFPAPGNLGKKLPGKHILLFIWCSRRAWREGEPPKAGAWKAGARGPGKDTWQKEDEGEGLGCGQRRGVPYARQGQLAAWEPRARLQAAAGLQGLSRGTCPVLAPEEEGKDSDDGGPPEVEAKEAVGRPTANNA